jgi:Haem-binding uptake, Tiki superfamily, ChaN
MRSGRTRLAAAVLLAAAAASAAAGGKDAPALDWRALAAGPARVIYVGDRHDVRAIKRELAAHMEDFADAGITDLALEMLPREDQPLLDACCGTPASRAAVLKAIGPYWMSPPGDYLALIEAARAAGIRPRALNVDPDGGRRDGDGAGPAACSDRNLAMAATLEGFLAQPRPPGAPPARVLVFIGAEHARADAMPLCLKNDGIASRSYRFRERGTPPEDGTDRLEPASDSYDGWIVSPSVLLELGGG